MNEAVHENVLLAARDTLLVALPDAWAIYVHGSFARGDSGTNSDLDLAILLPPGLKLPDRLTLMATVASRAGRDVDIVNLREAGLDLIHELLRDGRPLHIRCPDEVLGWEAERMSEYAEFNPRRADILSRYMQEPLRTSP